MGADQQHGFFSTSGENSSDSHIDLKMQRVPSHIMRFVTHSAEQSVGQTFGRHLPPARIISACRNEGIKYSVKIRNNLCVKKADGTVGLPASATLALFDELSSYAVVIKDRTCRFGVSVFLTTELVGDIPAGSDVIVSVKATKIGKTLGFITMEMFDAQNRLVAHGRHIKYLPMGWIWDIFAHPLLSPITFPLVDSLAKNKAFKNSFLGCFAIVLQSSLLLSGGNQGYASGGGTDVGETDIVNSTFRLIGVSPLGAGAGGAAAGDGRIDEYNLDVKPALCNMIGRLHGGALAMAIESSAILHKHSDRLQKDQQRGQGLASIRCIEIQYLSAMKNKHLITCEPFIAGNNRTAGNVYDNKNQVCAQYYCYWTSPPAVKTD